jgi:hypothetical protein
MNPITMGAVAAPIIGGILGNVSASSGRKAAAAAAAAALAQLNAVGVPPDMSKEIILRQYQSQGVLTPELVQDINLQSSETAQIKEDPSLRNAEMEVINTLGLVSRGGLRPEDRLAYNELRQKTQQDAESKRQQILQSMQAQGQGGSGNALIAQLQAGQAAEDAASAQSDRLAAQASQNALQALNSRLSAAGNVRGQDLNIAQTRAQAIDDRNRFLYENSRATQQANINARNNAQQANLQNAQRLSEMNVTQGNQELQRQTEAKRQYFNDSLNLASAKANALNNQGSVLQSGANQKASMFSNLGNAIGQGFAAYGSNQPKVKTATDASSIYDYVPKMGQGDA